MKNHLKKLVLAAGVALAFSGVGYADPVGSILVTNIGPLDSFSINTTSFDGSSGVIEEIKFDLSGTVCGGGGCGSIPLTFGGIVGTPAFLLDLGAIGSATSFGSVGSSVFGFTFSGFNTFDVFRFGWDPDTAADGLYGATVADLVGTVITAMVSFPNDTFLSYSGTMGIVGPDVSANLSPTTNVTPVPEPEIYAMLAAGLGLMGFVGRRRRKEQIAA